MTILVLSAVFCMEISIKRIVLFCSVSTVKCRFDCMELKYVRTACIFVWLESKMRWISSTQRK